MKPKAIRVRAAIEINPGVAFPGDEGTILETKTFGLFGREMYLVRWDGHPTTTWCVQDSVVLLGGRSR